MSTIDEVRRRLKVTNLQSADPNIVELVSQATYVGLYVMKETSTGAPEWEKASIEGALYVVKRSVEPIYHCIIKNQLGTEDLIEIPTTEWDLDVHPNYLLYRLGDGTIKGLWFHDDEERKAVLRELSAVLEDLKERKARPQEAHAPVQSVPQPDAAKAGAAILNMLVGQSGANGAAPAAPAYTGYDAGAPADSGDSFPISKGRIKSTLVELVSSDRFLDDLMIRLRHA